MSVSKEERQILLDSLSLVQVCRHPKFNIPVTRGDTKHTGGASRERCPLCGHEGSFVTINDRLFHCHHCKKGGNVLDLLQLKTGSSHYGFLLNLTPETSKFRKQEVQRRVTLEAIFNLYKEQLTEEHLAPLHARGLYPLDCGYSPSSNFLKENHYTNVELEDLGLLSLKGRELYYDHVVFPIRNIYGQITHFQGRALNPNAKTRWIGSRNQNNPISNQLFNLHKLQDYKRKQAPFITDLFVTEGITDTQSLCQLQGEVTARETTKEIQLQALGTLGINVDLTLHAQALKAFSVTFIYDNTKYPLGHPRHGKYLSWDQMLPSIIEFYVQRGRGGVYCLPVPNEPGVEDVNDFCQWIDWCPQVFVDYFLANAKSLEQFVIDYYEEQEFLPLLVKAVSVTRKEKYVEQLNQRILKYYPTLTEYILDRC